MRDPRVDPRPGDVLRRNTLCQVKVTGRDGDCVTWETFVDCPHCGQQERKSWTAPLETWKYAQDFAVAIGRAEDTDHA